jgi:hypothetical protein
MADVGKLYGASPFDPADPRDRRSEEARKLLVTAAIDALDKIDAPDGEALQDVAGGLLVGLVCVMSSMIEGTDENHASLRAGLLELVPWSIDMMRSIQDLPPLATDRSRGSIDG